MTMYVTALVVFVSLMFANFIWQAFKEREWHKAMERSFFQAVALGAFLLVMASR